MDDWRTWPCFYVSVVDAGRLGLLAGPFPVHGLALDLVDLCNHLACESDDRAWFYAYGTVRMTVATRFGILNKEIGYDAIIERWEEAHRRHLAWMTEEREKERVAGCSR